MKKHYIKIAAKIACAGFALLFVVAIYVLISNLNEGIQSQQKTVQHVINIPPEEDNPFEAIRKLDLPGSEEVCDNEEEEYEENDTDGDLGWSMNHK